jgi:hypothetical protein
MGIVYTGHDEMLNSQIGSKSLSEKRTKRDWSADSSAPDAGSVGILTG